MASAAVERMRKTVQDGNYYEAQQLIKILYFRNYTQQKIEAAKEILIEGTITMLSANQTTCATELVNLLLSLFLEKNVLVDSNSVEIITSLAHLFPPGDKGKISILKAALKWASTNELYKNGHSILHEQLARSYVEIQEYSLASKHYLKAAQPHEFASMLISWANEGYALSEKDLYIARSVLMYLSMGNLKDAKVIYQIFVSTLSSSQISPLINFLKLLLLTLESKTYSVFDILRKKYKVSLSRDPLFNQYLDHIAQLYYTKKQPAAPGGFGNLITDLFSNLLSGGGGGAPSEHDPDLDFELGAEDVD